MKLILTRLVLTNFKGIRSLDIGLDDSTNIFGQNGTGKTTIADAFFWLLFDKDSTDRKDFEIKTLDDNNQPYHKLEHEVTGYLLVDGVETVLRKSLREKWTKPRGIKDEVFAGHETALFWNDVPLKANEYKAKIDSLVNETTFKLLTNPLYFNNTMKWQDRRGMLLQIAGDINDYEILTDIGAHQDLITAFDRKKTIEGFKAELSAKKKKIKDEKDLLPARIDEAKRSMPEDVDYNSINAELTGKNADLNRIEDLLLNSSKAEKERQDRLGDLHAKKQGLSRQMLDIEFQKKEEVRGLSQARVSALNEAKNDLATKHNALISLTSKKEKIGFDIEAKKREQQQLRTSWTSINNEAMKFDESEFCCPACKRAFEDVDIESKKAELTANFNKNKSDRLEANKAKGIAVGEDIATLTAELGNINSEISVADQELEKAQNRVATLNNEHQRLTQNEQAEVENAIDNDPTYLQCKADRELCDQELNAPATASGKAELISQKQQIQSDIRELEAQLNTKGQKEKAEARIVELEKQESEMAQELANLEGIEYSIEQFTRAKMDLLEQRVNGLFHTVKFKMFEQQINGGQSETCVALINGVPFSDANTASKVNAGVDIINVLSRHFGVYAPIFIDNRESVTKLIETESQVINLVVSEKDKKLRFTSNAAVAAN